MKRSNRKGFTTVELVIVIAVIAILAAVMIPTFVSLIKKAEESAYLQEKTNQMILDMQEEVLNKDYMTWEEFETELQKLLDEKLAGVNTGLTEDQVREIINAALSKLNTNTNGLTKAQVEKIIKNALKDLDVSGLTKEEVEAIIKDLLENWTPSNPTEPEQPTEPQPTEPEGTKVTDLAGLKAALADPTVDYIILDSALALDETLSITRDLTIDLNGKNISYVAEDTNMFEIASGVEFNAKNGSVTMLVIGGEWVEGVVFASAAGSASDRTKVTLDGVTVYAAGAQGGEIATVFEGNSYNDITTNGSSFILPGKSAQVGNVSYSGDYTVAYFKGNSTNSTFTMNGGKAEMKGTGSMSFVSASSTYTDDNDYNSNVVINVNNAEIVMEDNSAEATGAIIVFSLNNTISNVNVSNTDITIDGADEWDDGDECAAYLTKRTAKYGTNNRGFHGTITMTATNITATNISDLEFTEDNKAGAFGGTCTITGGTYTDNVKNWTADGYSCN